MADKYEAHLTPGYMYGAQDVDNPVFPEYNNFGYWKDVVPPGEPITRAHRVTSQENMYQRVFEAADIGPEDVVLEVACGRGKGAKLLHDTIGPLAIHGVDFSEHQVERARAALTDTTNVHIQQSAAEDLPFDDNAFTKAFSLEAVQHFTSPEAFAHELGRVVGTAGTIAVASFFTPTPTSEAVVSQIAELLPTFRKGTYSPERSRDNAIYIYDMTKWLKQAGFCDVEFTTIGDNVWERFVEWRDMKVSPPSKQDWLEAYHRHLFDYYVITATKN